MPRKNCCRGIPALPVARARAAPLSPLPPPVVTLRRLSLRRSSPSVAEYRSIARGRDVDRHRSVLGRSDGRTPRRRRDRTGPDRTGRDGTPDSPFNRDRVWPARYTMPFGGGGGVGGGMEQVLLSQSSSVRLAGSVRPASSLSLSLSLCVCVRFPSVGCVGRTRRINASP